MDRNLSKETKVQHRDGDLPLKIYEKISKVFASMMNVEFNEELFAQNPMAYIDMFEPLVAENNLNLFIATDEQAKQFKTIVEQMLENKKVNQNS